MLTASPFLHFFDRLVAALSQPWSKDHATEVGRSFVIFLLLQLPWLSRAIAVPTLASMATAISYGYADDAKEIVVDSIAITFIFELDVVFYNRVLTRGARRRFEMTPYPESTRDFLSDSGAVWLISVYGWLNFFLDFAFMTIVYLATLGMLTDPWGWIWGACPESSATNQNACVSDAQMQSLFFYMMSRGALLGVAQLHLSVRAESLWTELRHGLSITNKAGLRKLCDLAALLIPLAFTMAQGLVAMLLFYWYLLNGTMGISATPVLGLIAPQVVACLESTDKSNQCQNLGARPDGSSTLEPCLLNFGDVWSGAVGAWSWWPARPERADEYSWLSDPMAPLPSQFQWLDTAARTDPNSTSLQACIDIPSYSLQCWLMSRYNDSFFFPLHPSFCL